MKQISFPAWLFINEEKHCPWLVGESTTLPVSLPVFSTEELAKRVGPKTPFVIVQVNAAMFYDLMGSWPNIEEIVLDIGSEGAAKFVASDMRSQG